MTYQPFLIAPFNTGLDTDQAPWLLPQDAFTTFENVHIRHQYIEKRQGYYKLADLVQNNGTNWDIGAITQANPGVVTVTSTAGLANGNEIEIRNVSGMTEVNNERYLVAGLTGTTFNLTDLDGNNVDTSGFTAYTTGGEVYLVPRTRVMGLENYVDSTGVRQLIAFDTERACIYNTSTDQFDPLDTSDIFTSANTDYIWAANWSSAAATASLVVSRMYFTNGKSNAGGATDGIRYYDPAASSTTTTQYNPNINSSVEIRGSKLIFVLRGRLVLLYTYEAANTYQQRARWCQIQNPSSATAWDDNVAGRGGFVDAPTEEHIISAQKLQDFLVVNFSNSVWVLEPTSNPALPFKWKKINSFRSCDGKMASTGFDQYEISAGIRGIVATDSVQTKRIDDRISLFVKEDINNAEFDKTFIRRSFGEQRTWMLYAQKEDSDATNALIYDDESQAFSTYTIPMNVLGYGGVSADYAFQDFTDAAFEKGELPLTFIEAGDDTFNSYFWDDSDQIFLGGDRNGTVFTLEAGDDDVGGEIASTIESAAWNPFKEQGQNCRMGYLDIFIDTHETAQFQFFFYKNNEQVPYDSDTINCLPRLREISQVVDIQKKTPATNGVTVSAPRHGLSTGNEIYIYTVKGMGEINGGPYEITVLNDDTFDIGVDSTNFAAYTTGGVVTWNPFYATKVWKRVYAGGSGYQHRVKITSSGADKPFRIHAFMPWFAAGGKKLV